MSEINLIIGFGLSVMPADPGVFNLMGYEATPVGSGFNMTLSPGIFLESPGAASFPPTTYSLATVAGAFALAGKATTLSTSAASSAPSVRVSGNILIDVNGAPLQLRGVNVSAYEFVTIDNPQAPPGGSSFDPWGGQKPSFSAMATWNINALRVPLNEQCYLGQLCYNTPGSPLMADPMGTYRSELKSFVDTATARGWYVILDLHKNSPPALISGSTVQTLSNTGGQSEMADAANSYAFWTAVATDYKDYPNVIFDLFNEPHLDNLVLDTTGLSDAQIQALIWSVLRDGGTDSVIYGNNQTFSQNHAIAGMQGMLNAVRATGATNVCMTAGRSWAQDTSQWVTYAPVDPLHQLACSWHAYTNGAGTGPGFPDNFIWAQAILDAGYPIIIGETGEALTTGVSRYLAPTLLPWADAHGVSVMCWSWNPGWAAPTLVSDASGTPVPSAVAVKSWYVNHSTHRKFNPVDAAMSISSQQNVSLVQAQSDINALAAHPVPGGNGAQMYVVGFRWPALETGITNNNLQSDAINGTGQYAGFQQILTIYAYLQSKIPGAHFGLSVIGNVYGQNYTASLIKSRNWSTSGLIVPPYIAACGGSLAVPNSLGSGSSTTYPVAPIYSGSGYYGIGFSSWTGTVLTNGLPAWWNPGVNQCWINFWQALSLFQYTAPTGHPLAGQKLTFDTDPLFEYIFSNDEYSYGMLSGFNPTDAGGVTVNPPLSTNSANLPSNSNMFAAYKLWAQKATSFFPHTMVGTCFTYGFLADHGNDAPSNVASYVNQNITAGALSTIQGLALSGADTYCNDFGATNPVANSGKQGFIGIATPLQPTGLGTVTNASLAGYMPKIAQMQPLDYSTNLGGVAARAAATITALASAANNAHYQSTHRLWWMGDATTFGNTAWTSYIQPALVAGVTPFSTTRPSNLP